MLNANVAKQMAMNSFSWLNCLVIDDRRLSEGE